MPLMAVLSLFPMALTYPAWRSQLKLAPPLSRTRLFLFRCGLFLSIVCSLAVVASWFDPFPLLSDGHGGYSDIRNGTLFSGALFTALLTIGLAIFGRGAARLLLVGSGVLLTIAAFGAFLSNGV
jgi:hypothetical protein